MAQCLSPFTKKGENIPLPCGRCYECKARRVSGWSFRMMKEQERSRSALFVTLTYSPENMPMTNGYMNLHKPDLQKFMKRLRHWNKGQAIKYYAAGEYGTTSWRPHYHIILFNADQEDILKAWTLGHVHIGLLTEASAAYTLKYISKGKRVPAYEGDPRLPEFSVMSKKLGDNYLTPQMRRWHKKSLVERMYVPLKDGKKIAMPRYYREKIYTKVERDKIAKHLELESNTAEAIKKYFDDFEKNELIRINKIKK